MAQSIAETVSPPIDTARVKKQIGYFRYGISILIPFNKDANPVYIHELWS
jgi:hypothetical protein